MDIVWKPVVGFEGLYEVSNFGQVKSLLGKRNKILKPGKRGKGYKHVVLSNGTQAKAYSVHRLVAQAFVPNPQNLATVNHINEHKLDNRDCNLEWMGAQDNVIYSQSITRCAVNPEGIIIEFFNVSEFIRENKFTKSKFYDMLSGRKDQYKGWTRA